MKSEDLVIIKAVALPVEHGATVMFGEALCAGLFIAASLDGVLTALGWVFLFLMFQPLKSVLKDVRQRVFIQRTRVAAGCAAVALLLTVVFFAAEFVSGGGNCFLVFLGAIPLGGAHLWSVVYAGRKDLLTELLGVLSLGAVAASIILSSGHSYVQAMTLWLILAIRGVTSVLYVRHRFNSTRGRENNFAGLVLIHLGAMVLLGLFVAMNWVKPVVLAAGSLLLARLIYIPRATSITAKVLGVQESLLGLAFTVLLVAAF